MTQMGEQHQEMSKNQLGQVHYTGRMEIQRRWHDDDDDDTRVRDKATNETFFNSQDRLKKLVS